MNPRAMGEFIVRIADAFDLDHPHVVAPDIGTSSTLFAAAANPGRFRCLVIGSGGAAVPITVTGVLKDWVVPPVNAEYLGDRLPHSRVDFIAGAGHFCSEEKPDEYASLVAQWWQENCR
jgi:pimeloyl-ACP methyl ester carboxylesterase